MFFWDGEPWFYICDDETAEYPKPYCAVFFGQTLQASLPTDWVLSWDGKHSSLLPRWWAKYADFLEDLLNGVPQAVQLFDRERTRLARSERGTR